MLLFHHTSCVRLLGKTCTLGSPTRLPTMSVSVFRVDNESVGETDDIIPITPVCGVVFGGR